MSTADLSAVAQAGDFQGRCLRESYLPPSPTVWTSDFPYTLLLGTLSQDVSPPSVIWVTHFPFVMYVHPVRYIPNLYAMQVLTNNLTG